MVPLSVLGQLRHEMVRQLDGLWSSRVRAGSRQRISCRGCDPRSLLRGRQDESARQTAEPLQLHVLCRSLEQLEAALDSRCHERHG